MRFVIVGAGAIGGVVGGRLAQHGHDVVLVARGAHGAAIAADGLLVRSPDDEVRVPVPTVERRATTSSSGTDDVVLLAVKSQDTQAVLDDLVDGPADLRHRLPAERRRQRAAGPASHVRTSTPCR